MRVESTFHTSATISAEVTPVSSLNSLMAAFLGSSLSSTPPWFKQPYMCHFSYLLQKTKISTKTHDFLTFEDFFHSNYFAVK